MLLRGDRSEGQAVVNASSPWGVLSGPDHVGLHLDDALLGLETDTERGLGLETLGQIHTGAPLAHVPGPPHPDISGRGVAGLVQDREHDQVSAELPPLGVIRHDPALDRDYWGAMKTSDMKRGSLSPCLCISIIPLLRFSTTLSACDPLPLAPCAMRYALCVLLPLIDLSTN
jgi:hypothetical protein